MEHDTKSSFHRLGYIPSQDVLIKNFLISLAFLTAGIIFATAVQGWSLSFHQSCYQGQCVVTNLK